jgi:hypothetical protein
LKENQVKVKTETKKVVAAESKEATDVKVAVKAEIAVEGAEDDLAAAKKAIATIDAKAKAIKQNNGDKNSGLPEASPAHTQAVAALKAAEARATAKTGDKTKELLKVKEAKENVVDTEVKKTVVPDAKKDTAKKAEVDAAAKKADKKAAADKTASDEAKADADAKQAAADVETDQTAKDAKAAEAAKAKSDAKAKAAAAKSSADEKEVADKAANDNDKDKEEAARSACKDIDISQFQTMKQSALAATACDDAM